MSDFVVSRLNSMSLRILPIIMIMYCLFSIFSAFMGYLLFSELGTSARLQSWNNSRKNTLQIHMFISVIVLLVSILYLRAVW
jgi:hypothetical protein